jgi:glycosyltransferase involved in cell wall biosynthesis
MTILYLLPVTELLLIALIACTLLQLVYIWACYARLAFAAPPAAPPDPQQARPVSIVVAARNELDNLQRLIPALLQQSLPDFEVIVVDDRSDDGSYDYLLELTQSEPRVRLVRVNDTPEHVNGKKYALTLGIKAARHEAVLLTDADCLPASPDWALHLQAAYAPGKAIVLGFSQYHRYPGLLNLFIRYETFYVGVQYLSMALCGRPFMGVGRNLSYQKSLFLGNKGFFKHKHVTGGDDDLFINEVATGKNTAVAWLPDAQTVSEPKRTWHTWYRQKMRHLGVGQYYRTSNKLLLGLLSATHAGSYAVALLALFVLPWWMPAAAYTLRMGSLLAVLAQAGKRLGHAQPWAWAPLLDAIYIFYYIFVGISALGSKRTTWN